MSERSSPRFDWPVSIRFTRSRNEQNWKSLFSSAVRWQKPSPSFAPYSNLCASRRRSPSTRCVDEQVDGQAPLGLEPLDEDSSVRAYTFQSIRRVSSPGGYRR